MTTITWMLLLLSILTSAATDAAAKANKKQKQPKPTKKKTTDDDGYYDEATLRNSIRHLKRRNVPTTQQRPLLLPFRFSRCGSGSGCCWRQQGMFVCMFAQTPQTEVCIPGKMTSNNNNDGNKNQINLFHTMQPQAANKNDYMHM